MRTTLATLVSLAVVAGCSPSENAIETKASDVKLNMSQEQQDKIAEDLKNWTPDKKK